MSRIGRLPIPVPSGVDITINGQEVQVKGPKGTLTHTVAEPIKVSRDEDGVIQVARPNDENRVRALHGLSRTLIANMVQGVTQGFSKSLENVGVGYRVQAKGPTQLEFSLGFSHPVILDAPEGITFRVAKPTLFHVDGIDKQTVGEVAATSRKLRNPDPHQGKGVPYPGEQIRRKVGKAGK